MAQFSPNLIDQTITIFKPRTVKAFSKEDARQALENICGFFQILQEWTAAEDETGYGARQYRPASIKEAKA